MSRIRKPKPQNFNAPRKCGGKFCYETRFDAEQVVAEKAITDPEVELAIYRCMSCGTWHLTSAKK